MVVINYSGEEINAKIVYYGPGLSGKTTNLEFIYSKMPTEVKGKMVSMKTRTDRTLFFDFLPIELGDVSGYRTRFLLYTVPGQVYYNATRKLVLKGSDAVVFVADSSRSKLDENLESLGNLEENLNEHDLTLDTIPWVIQYNKRDVEDAMSVEELDEQMNLLRVPSFEAVATEGTGIYETFQGIARLLYRDLKKRFESPETRDGVPKVVKESAAANAAKRSTPESAVQTSNFDRAKPAARAPVSCSPPSRTRTAKRNAESMQPGGDRGSVFSAVDKALREIDSTPAAEDTRDTNIEPLTKSKAAGDEYHFAPMDSLESDLGRILELDDTPKPIERKKDTADESTGNGFIKDPCSSAEIDDSTRKEKKKEKEKEEEVQVEIEPVHRARLEHTPSSSSVLTVPIVISRSQVRKTVPLKLVLEIQVTDED